LGLPWWVKGQNGHGKLFSGDNELKSRDFASRTPNVFTPSSPRWLAVKVTGGSMWFSWLAFSGISWSFGASGQVPGCHASTTTTGTVPGNRIGRVEA